MDEPEYFSNAAMTTASAPMPVVTPETLLATMRKMRESSQRLAEFVDREWTYVAMSDFGYFRTVTRQDIRDWSRGQNVPSILDDFGGWWIATSVRYRLESTKYYAVRKPKWDSFTFEPQSIYPEPRYKFFEGPGFVFKGRA